jgi:hypothetical protein
LRLRPTRILAVAATLVGVAACGQESHPTVADNEGFYVDAGPITYQVQLSRELNPSNAEDRAYLNGVTAPAPAANEEWFAIFLRAKNQTKAPATTTDSFVLFDTQGNKYYPVALNAAVDPFAWTPQTLTPSATEPAPDTPASFGPTQGGEVLFKINTSSYANRPLTLEIHAAGQAIPSTVSIDL